MIDTQLLLIDLSSLAHPLYHMSASEPDPNWTSTQTVARVRALSTQHPHCAICCDGPGPTFRHALSPRVERGDGTVEGYKANRPERDARLTHQIDVAIARLRGDGYPIWGVEGFEADDVIAAAVRYALAIEDVTVLIASADKDLLQLVNDRVTFKSTAPKSDGAIRDAAAVKAKFGVTPAQMLDYLCLVGDASDNIVGAKGIGGVIAARLLTAHGSLEQIYEKMARGVVPGITPALRSSLVEFKERWPIVAQLVALRADIEIPFAEIAAERTAPPMTEEATMETELSDEAAIDSMNAAMQSSLDRINAVRGTASPSADLHAPASSPAAPTSAAAAPSAFHSSVQNGGDSGTQPRAKNAAPSQSQEPVLDAEESSSLLAPITDFALQLEPRTMKEAVALAQRLFDSKSGLLKDYGYPQAVLLTILAGREIGIPAITALTNFHIIKGVPRMSAALLVGLVLKSGKAEYFHCTERTVDHATFETQRKGDIPSPPLTFTIEQGRRAYGFTDTMTPKERADLERAWILSGWGKNVEDMLVARASSKLARLVYSDVTAGLYAAEEME